jgi:nitric-oxide synthase
MVTKPTSEPAGRGARPAGGCAGTGTGGRIAGCPAHAAGLPPGAPQAARADSAAPADPDAAACFLELFHTETGDPEGLSGRLAQVLAEISRYGTYQHTQDELVFGARVAWRNSNRCIGRLYWRSLRIRDRRHVTAAEAVAAECVTHLREATNDGKIRPVITVFAPDSPFHRGPRVHNTQLVRYAGHLRADGAVLGDPLNVGWTARARELGWTVYPRTAFDPLPLMVSPGHRIGDEAPEPIAVPLPPDAVLEVPLAHPALPWFADLGLRWHAVPAVSDMCLEIGGICYRAAPFNGWYLGTEIGARNLADEDRYDLLPEIAKRLGLDVATERSLWRDRALVELNLAVLHSYDRAGVTLADHHNESRRFLSHLQKEERAGRPVPADWTWIVPPVSGGATPVFHRYYDNLDLRPAFVRHGD